MARLSYKTVSAVIAALLVIGEAKSTFKRSTYLLHNPCGVILNDNVGTTNTPLVNTAADLIVRLEDVNDEVTHFTMRNPISRHVLNYVSSKTFMDGDTMLVNANTKQDFINEPAKGMLKHYRQLYELITYIQYIRTYSGELGSLLREDLNSVETSIYSLICSLKIGLLNAGVETMNTYTLNTLSSNFLRFDENYTYEIYRAYIVIGDTERIIEYLNTMYTELYSQLSA